MYIPLITIPVTAKTTNSGNVYFTMRPSDKRKVLDHMLKSIVVASSNSLSKDPNLRDIADWFRGVNTALKKGRDQKSGGLNSAETMYSGTYKNMLISTQQDFSQANLDAIETISDQQANVVDILSMSQAVQLDYCWIERIVFTKTPAPKPAKSSGSSSTPNTLDPDLFQ